MEPLRDSAFNMGSNGFWSWIWSLAFVVVGALAIALNHLIRFLRKPREVNKLTYIIGSASVGAVTIALVVVGVILMAGSSFTNKLALDQFNVGLILLFLGIAVLFGLLITLPPLLIKKKEEANA